MNLPNITTAQEVINFRRSQTDAGQEELAKKFIADFNTKAELAKTAKGGPEVTPFELPYSAEIRSETKLSIQTALNQAGWNCRLNDDKSRVTITVIKKD